MNGGFVAHPPRLPRSPLALRRLLTHLGGGKEQGLVLRVVEENSNGADLWIEIRTHPPQLLV